MTYEEEDIQLLAHVGFTKTQAKLYLTLLRIGDVDGKTLAKIANIPRTIVYRILDELHEMGMVEKEIVVPYQFRATPLKEGLQILMAQKLQQFEESREKTERLLLKHQNFEKLIRGDQYKFSIIQGKGRILQVIKKQFEVTNQSVSVVSTFSRWLQIVHHCIDNYNQAMKRGVKFQVVLERQAKEIELGNDVKTLLANKNFELKLIRGKPSTNLAIFDRKEAAFNLFPSSHLAESPFILTNNAGFVEMCQDHFNSIWNLAESNHFVS